MKYTQNQVAVTSFSLAVSEKWKDQAGQDREEVCFVDCTAWKRMAEIVSQYCKKGTQVAIVGKLKLEQWNAQDGSKRSKHSVKVRTLELLGGKPPDNAPGHHGHYEQPQPQQPIGEEQIPF
jgi:single-strand DNA-binding protein